MDSGRFQGFSGRDFCSCGRQNFACVKPNLDSVFGYLSRLEFARKRRDVGATNAEEISLL